MYSTGKPVDQQLQKAQIYVYKEFFLTVVYTIVSAYLSLLLIPKKMAVNLIEEYNAAFNKPRIVLQSQISRSVSSESDSACSETSCDSLSSIPEIISLTSDYNSDFCCSSEFSDSTLSSFSLKSSSPCEVCDTQVTNNCEAVVHPQDFNFLSLSFQNSIKESYAAHQPVFIFPEKQAEPENMELKVENAITAGELVHLINNNECILLLDCRSFMVYNANHITGSLNIGCSDRITRKRLADGKIQIADVVLGKEERDMYRRLEGEAHIIVYDDSTVDLMGLAATQSIKILADCLRKQNRTFRFLLGGLQMFQQSYSGMCTNPEPVASVPILFSPTSPELNVDIDAAVVSEILPHILIGNQRDASDRERLMELGITHVINVTSQLPLHFENEGLIYKRLPASDSGSQNLKQYFQEAIEFIDGACASNGRVLVHCQAGVSRSPTIVIAYLMARSQKTLAEAFAFVKERRSIVAPNLNFMGQLLEFEQNSVKPSGLCPPALPVHLLHV